ncbi:MAG TPA: hypothetical protein QKA08_01410 [Candidatus Megaira endosymbiont of Nemacystus decipiens]|nr:hypothetical protein [Candidatus Megaera endosymbiont of Nemacystus decipiens]
MITLLASIAGFFSSIIPEIIKYFKDISDKNYQLKILEKRIKYNKLYDEKELEDINISRDIAEQNVLYSTYHTHIKWVDSLNGSVRPVLAYSFFIMYMSVKYMQYRLLTQASNIIEYINIIWSVDDQAIFAGIISFYYGQRTFRKFWKNK